MNTLPKNVLVVDHDPVRNLRTALILKRLEYNVFVASSGADMLRIANGLLPNLALIDLRMPFIEGQTCLERIKTSPKTSMIKVVLVADESDKGHMEEKTYKGASAYLVRPFTPTLLYSTIQGLTEPSPRKRLRLRMIFKVNLAADGATRACFATMLSENGVFVRTMNPLAAGTRMRIGLELPSAKPIVLEGEVLYEVKFNRDNLVEPGMGIRFLNQPQAVENGLRKFIEDNLTGDLDDSLLL